MLTEKLRDARYLHGYSSMIYELATVAADAGYSKRDFPQLKLIKGTSEKILHHYSEQVEQVFGRPMRSEYGAAEAGIIAFECPYGSMHVNMENCIVEIDDNKEILVTNLNSNSFPIIRYRLGDQISISARRNCECGRDTMIIEEVTGRVGKMIYGSVKKYPSLTIYYVLKTLYFDHGISLSLQFVQKKLGELEIYSRSPICKHDRSKIDQKMLMYFGSDVVWRYMESGVRTRTGKIRDFVSEIDVD